MEENVVTNEERLAAVQEKLDTANRGIGEALSILGFIYNNINVAIREQIQPEYEEGYSCALNLDEICET